MKTKKTVYTITEYDSFVSGLSLPGSVTLPKATFEQLEEFLLSRQSPGTVAGVAADTPSLMELRVKRGVGKVITAKNYVGILLLKNGTVIEILPKIFSRPFSRTEAKPESKLPDSHVPAGAIKAADGIITAEQATPEAVAQKVNAAKATADQNHVKARILLVEMLKTLKSAPFQSLQSAPLETANLPLLELFIQMFLNEVFRIVKHGLKCCYQPVQSNETQFKGKWKIAQHITHNYAHKERAFLEYDCYQADRAENRLLKATLLLLYQISTSFKNRGTIKILLNEFREITASVHYQEDFLQCVPDRTMQHYETALQWCRIFLNGQSFTPFSGSDTAVALLFPMELLFERYVAAKLKKRLSGHGFQVLLQDTSRHLFDEPRRQFLLRPDIVVIRDCDQAIFLLDTKWKLLSANRRQYGISSEDMYQMYVYQKKYQAQDVRLLYPVSPEFQAATEKPIVFRSLEEQGDAAVLVEFIDLFDMEKSLERILEGISIANDKK